MVPGPGLLAEATVQPSANNLDIVEHDGAWFFAFRTAPSHFASAETQLQCAASTDRETWTFETTLFLQTDLREPLFVDHDPPQFYRPISTATPRRSSRGARDHAERLDGTWSEPVDLFGTDDTFILKCTCWMGERAMMNGYRGGEEVYEFLDGPPRHRGLLARLHRRCFMGLDLLGSGSVLGAAPRPTSHSRATEPPSPWCETKRATKTAGPQIRRAGRG